VTQPVSHPDPASGPSPVEHQITVRRTARYYTLGGTAVPDSAAAETRSDAGPESGTGSSADAGARGAVVGPSGDIWIVCHGYAQLARSFIRAFAAVAGPERIIVAPEALNRFYHERPVDQPAAHARVAATWMTREARDTEIADYIAYLDDVAAHVARGASAWRTLALGFSQGAATASRWAARGGARIDDLVLWGAGPAPELEPAPDLFRGARVWVVAGDMDGYMDTAAVEAAVERLRSGGIDARAVHYHGGHRIDAAALAALADRVAAG
jgi:predicted esterase